MNIRRRLMKLESERDTDALVSVTVAAEPETVVVTIGPSQGVAEALYLAMIRCTRPLTYVLRDHSGNDIPPPSLPDSAWSEWLNSRLPAGYPRAPHANA